MPKATPFLLFDGDCAEAMRFYESCIGGELSIITVGDSPMKAAFPPELQSRVVNARLTKGDMEISASDWLLPSRTRRQGNSTCVYISGATYDELKSCFDKLSDGAVAETLDALRDMPFGSYGALTDKFGVRWMFQGDSKA